MFKWQINPYGLFNAKIWFISEYWIIIEEKAREKEVGKEIELERHTHTHTHTQRKRATEKEEKRREKSLVHWFNDTSSPYGLFNVKIWFIFKYVIIIEKKREIKEKGRERKKRRGERFGMVWLIHLTAYQLLMGYLMPICMHNKFHNSTSNFLRTDKPFLNKTQLNLWF